MESNGWRNHIDPDWQVSKYSFIPNLSLKRIYILLLTISLKAASTAVFYCLSLDKNTLKQLDIKTIRHKTMIFFKSTFSWFSVFGNLIKVAIPPARCRSWGLIGSFNFRSKWTKHFEKFLWVWIWVNFNLFLAITTPKILLENDNIFLTVSYVLFKVHWFYFSS